MSAVTGGVFRGVINVKGSLQVKSAAGRHLYTQELFLASVAACYKTSALFQM